MTQMRNIPNLVPSPEEALACLKSGHHVIIGSGAAEPQRLVHALPTVCAGLSDIEITHLMTLGEAPYTDPKYKDIFRHNALFIGANVREAIRGGNADYTPVFLSDQPSLIRSGRIPVNVVLILTTPPDRSGYVSLGTSVDILRAAFERADYIIAEINPNMPRTHGDSFIHINDIHAVVESDLPMLELDVPKVDDVARQVGTYVASLIDDGSTLQVGIGAIPNAVLAQLTNKKDLGVHTEMFSDGVTDLVEAGVINCKKKSINAGKVTSSFCFGTQRLYDIINDNPFFSFHPIDYTNDPFIIGQNEKMVAVNSALQIDLTGQICSDSIGSSFYSGFGGQVDFIRGAARSKGGKPIIAIPSTAKGGTISRIVPVLDAGAGVVTTRADAHYVVTEYGIAYLHGRNVRERALALISIAHPDHRKSLLDEAKRLRYVYQDQIDFPVHGRPYPGELEAARTIKDDLEIRIRPLKPEDERLLRDLFYSHTKDTIYYRYMTPLKSLPKKQIQRFVTIDYDKEMAFAATIDTPTEEFIGVARYYVDRTTNLAEIALTVHDDYQGCGLGSELLRYIVQVARSRGLDGFTGQLLADNIRMLHLFHKICSPVHTTMRDNVISVKILFEEMDAHGSATE